MTDLDWGTHEMVDPRLIVIDHAYQREVKPQVVENIAAHFDPRAFGRPICFRRDNGVLYCADGQQRITAALALPERPKLIPIVWHPMPGVKLEAQVFWTINVFRRALTPIEKHESAYVAGNPADVAIRGIVEDLGYSIGKSHASRSIGAISALHEIYNLGGEQLVRDTLVLVQSAWPDDKKAFDQNLLRVIAGLIDQKNSNGGYERQKVTAALARTGPAALFRKAEEIHFNQGTPKRESIRRAVKALARV